MIHSTRTWLIAIPLCMPAAACVAHGVEESLSQGNDGEQIARGPQNWNQLWRAWEFEPWVVIPLLLSAYWYAAGSYRIWRSAGVGHGIRVWETAAYWSGWLALVVALVSPLHAWGSMLFSVHMTQHEILMLAAAPLLVLGRPMIGILKGLPVEAARDLVRCTSAPWWRAVWRVLTVPVVAWMIHAALLWIWHVPKFFEATLSSEFIHALQHLCFIGSALLFWWAVMQGPHRALNFGIAVLYMFTTALHSGALGALITFAATVWYPAYERTAPIWGLTALEDQQLGGAIMWIPACTVYIIAGLALAAGLLRSSGERMQNWERLATPIRILPEAST